MRPKFVFYFSKIKVPSWPLVCSWASLVFFMLLQLLKDCEPWSVPIQTLIKFYSLKVKTHLKANMNSGIIYPNYMISPKIHSLETIYILFAPPILNS